MIDCTPGLSSCAMSYNNAIPVQTPYMKIYILQFEYCVKNGTSDKAIEIILKDAKKMDEQK